MVKNAEVDPGLTREDQAEMFARTVIAGHPQGAMRRIILYFVAFVSLTIGFVVPAALAVTAGALTLLVATDQLA